MPKDATVKEQEAPVPEVWRGDVAAGKAGGHTLGENLLGNAMTPEEVAAVVKAHPNYAGPILGAAAKKLGNTVATKAAELSETADHSAHVYGRDAMTEHCDTNGLDAKDKTAPDPNTKLPFDPKTGSWDGLKIADRLGQYDKIGGTDNDGDRCTFANLLTTKVLAGAGATQAYLENVRARVGSGAIELKEGRSDAMGAAANALGAIAKAIEKKTATYGDLSWAQESLYEVFVDFVGSGTVSAKITNFLGEDQGLFTIGNELSGSPVAHDVLDTESGCILDALDLKDWASSLGEGEAYACAWIGPKKNVAAVSHQVMLVNHGGKKYIYDPERHDSGSHMMPIEHSDVKKYFEKGNRIAVTFKMNAPVKASKDKQDAAKKGATAKK